MNAVVSLTGHGGWPMTVFLTPGRRAVLRRHLLPAEPRQGMPAFQQVLAAVAEAYRDTPRRGRRHGRAADRGAGRRSARLPGGEGEPGRRQLLDGAVRGPARRRSTPSGAGSAARPSSRPPAAVEFLLRMHQRRRPPTPLAMAPGTLDAMAAGRHVRRARRRVRTATRWTAVWLVPHFEKMLYDNALLAARLPARLGGRPASRATARWPRRRSTTCCARCGCPRAASPRPRTPTPTAIEGSTYVWTPAAAAATRSAPRSGAAAASRTTASPTAGNFEGGDGAVGPPGRAAPRTCAGSARAAAARRATARPQPARDDKAIAAWNGLALAALAEAGWRLGRADYLDAARALRRRSCSGAMTRRDGRLLRSYRAGDAPRSPAFLDDHAAVAHGLLELHTATGEPRWLDEARAAGRAAVERFARPRGGRLLLLGRATRERLVARHKDLDDNPTPSGQSLMATVLLRLSRLDRPRRSRAGAERDAPGARPTCAPGAARLRPAALGRSTCTCPPPLEVAVVGPRDDPATEQLCRAPPAAAFTRPPSTRSATATGGDRAAAGGQGAGRRPPGGVRLRAVRLPGAGHRRRAWWRCA